MNPWITPRTAWHDFRRAASGCWAWGPASLTRLAKSADRRTDMLLENKPAVIYGAAGPVGSAVARACAREGAHVHLAGRTASGLERVAETIRSSGGRADVAQLDVLDRAAVERHARAVVGQH